VKSSEDEDEQNGNELEELDEEILAKVRFGPPGGNRKNIEKPSQSAGPSKLHSVKRSSEPKTKKGSKTRPVSLVYIILILVLIFDIQLQKNVEDDDVPIKAGGKKQVGKSSQVSNII